VSLPLAWIIVRPSLVFGTDGASVETFMTLATLPVIPIPGTRDQQVQPIHVDDLTAAVVAMVQRQDLDRPVRALHKSGATTPHLRIATYG